MERFSHNIETLPATEIFKAEKITPEIIRRIVERIVGHLNPQKIILFGSRARGQATDESDLDILVVMETEQPKFQRGAAISNLISPRFFSMDISVYTPEEFETAANHEDPWFNPFIKEVLEDGVVLYDRETH